MGAAIARFRRGLRRYGLLGSAVQALRLCRNRAYSTETHVWYELDLRSPQPRLDLPEGLELEQGEAALPLLEQLWPMGRAEKRRRLQEGATPWVVRDGREPAFSCWIFRGTMPLRIAPRGRLALPPDTATLEESVTVPGYRGRGIAPAAWSTIAAALADRGLARIVTPIEDGNVPARRGIEKAGFQELARTIVVRKLRTRIDVQPRLAATAFLVTGLLP
jgi:GNAT superfamily N-acetyltransferase